MQRRRRPALSGVGRYVDLPDAAVAGPSEPRDLIEAWPFEREPGRRTGDNGLHLHREHELPGFLVPEQDRVFRGLVLSHGRLGGELEPAQPFDIHVAFEPGQQQAHRVAVRWPHPLSVLVKAHERVIQSLGERNAAAHGGRVGAFGDDPAGRWVDAGLVEQGRELNPGPLRAAENAVDGGYVERQRLRRVERLAVAAAFDERDTRLHRIAVQRLERENEGPFHQSMDEQAVLLRIDVGNAGVAALEV